MPSIRLAAAVTVCLLLSFQEVEGQAAAPPDSIAALVARYDSSWNRKDSTAIGRLLAPEYYYFTSRGGVWRRAAVLGLVTDSTYLLKYARRREVEVTRWASAAVVSSRWEGGGSYRGKPFTDDQRCSLVWVESAGNWKLLSEHCTQIVQP